MSPCFLVIFLVAVDPCSLKRISTVPSTFIQKMNSGKLNGATLKFAVTHVSRNPLRIQIFLSAINNLLAVKYPPFNVLSLQADGNYTDTGSTPMFFAWLAEKLNFTYVQFD
jgi:hypothetical protein